MAWHSPQHNVWYWTSQVHKTTSRNSGTIKAATRFRFWKKKNPQLKYQVASEFQTNIVLEEFFVDEDESITEIQLQSRGPKTLGHFPSIAESREEDF